MTLTDSQKEAIYSICERVEKFKGRTFTCTWLGIKLGEYIRTQYELFYNLTGHALESQIYTNYNCWLTAREMKDIRILMLLNFIEVYDEFN